MTDEKDRTASFIEKRREEKRREERYVVPDVYQRYIALRVKSGDHHREAVLANFSRNGILFESPFPLEPGSETECIISLSRIMDREISFRINVKYCYNNNNSYIIGAAINTIADETWFDVFVEIHDFIVQRQDTVY